MRQTLRGLLEWLGGHELVVLLGLLVIVLGTWGFVALAGEVVEGDTRRFDDRMLHALRRADDPATPIGPAWMAEAGRDVTSLGSVAVTGLIAGSVVGFLWLDRRYAMMAMVLGSTVGGLVVSQALKSLYRRPRPDVVPHLMTAYSTSFPSGHSFVSVVVYLTLGALLTQVFKKRRLKFYVLALAVVLTGLVGVSRVYMGVHYPTDVLAGWTAGLVWATLCWLLGRALQRRGTIESEE